ncbi:hypothetical protein JK636_22790 [Clostridium sp. YIM B02515]|uniref:PH domain-containing protein n=1 Tax=Clostridium rhizosphaerae TaxID=2803861 RepID=A0ABS1TGP9_9CLOT|nr:hypothetical protein [Clostridium rhizosphaerae]MBL4938535.1 hypothetical protein [Clostridium rhizosphaerae]
MKPYRHSKLDFILIFLLSFYFVVLYFNNLGGFNISITIIITVSFAFVSWMMLRYKVTLKDDYIECKNPFILRKQILRYSEINCIKFEHYKHILLRYPVPAISILEKKNHKKIFIMYKLFRKKDLEEIIKFIKNKNNSVVLSKEVTLSLENSKTNA